jgi:hypothetical protein
MTIKLRPGMSLGAMSAEDDAVFLDTCFVDTSDLINLCAQTNPKCIALGRTGSGKSALISKLQKSNYNVKRIHPDSLSLNYISNSTIISYFEEIGIDLDVFYQLLWRHVLTIEILQLKKQLSDEKASEHFISNLFSRFNPNEKKKKALEYLFNYGTSFWSDTEHRVREVVNKIEESLKEQLGGSIEAFKIKIAAEGENNSTHSAQVTTDVIHKAQRVVHNVQIQELNSVMDFLAEDVFNDQQEKYYIVLDDLDTGWVHDKLRFKLVRALIETLRKFRRISNLKIVIGLRADLLQTVLNQTTSRGFQSEKYDDMMLRIKWTRENLKLLADKRINLLFKEKYTNQELGFNDLFTQKIAKQDTLDYMLDRTLHRPRDLIAFMNECLAETVSGTGIGQRAIRTAEAAYSRKRLRSLTDEWREAYGDLEEPINVLRELDVRFTIKNVTEKHLENLCINLLAGDRASDNSLFSRECELVSSNKSTYDNLRRRFLEILYIVGAIGVKVRSGSPYEWSFRNEPLLDYHSLSQESTFAIHPMLFRALNKRADPTSLV